MELHLNAPTDSTPAVLDFHRFVLLFTHSFSDRLRFVGELELEHAFVEGLEEGGELELEQAYLDFLVHPALNFRAGMMLVPVGIINERHEPPVFHGVSVPARAAYFGSVADGRSSSAHTPEHELGDRHSGDHLIRNRLAGAAMQHLYAARRPIAAVVISRRSRSVS